MQPGNGNGQADDLERLPLYYAWQHFNESFRAILIRSAMRPSDKIDYEMASVAEWVDLPGHVRAGIMNQFKNLAATAYKKLNDPKRIGNELFLLEDAS